MLNIPLPNYLDFKNEVISKGLKQFNYKKSGRYFLLAIDGPICFSHNLSRQNEPDYTANLLPLSNQKIGDEIVINPFASKGKNHFKGTGVKKVVAANSTGNVDLVIGAGTYRYNAIEVLNGDYGDYVQLEVVDTSLGTYSTIPDYTLDTFGINWNMSKELIKTLPYEATVFTGMILRVKYTNNTNADKEVYVNHDLHLIL